jgi:predicted nuclease of predicted toxin-antitoxin system
MTFVVDESVDFTIVKSLRANGLEVFAIAEQSPSISDDDVLSIAFRLNVPLITEDKDFGELVFRLNLPHHGILLLRLGSFPSEKKGEMVSKIILSHLLELHDAFCVFDGFNLRIRRVNN